MKIAATIVGILGVVLYISSYQFKKRKTIVTVYSIANFLYVLQYFLLGAFSGVAMDGLGFVSSLFAAKKENALVKKYHKLIIVVIDLLMVVAGIMLYKNIFSPFATIAVIIETSALWVSSEKVIRRITLVSAPFWLTYNLAFGAYGSAIGSVINIVSLTVAIIRYDFLKKEQRIKAVE